MFIREGILFIRESFLFNRESYALIRENNAFIRKLSFECVRWNFAFILDSFAFICETIVIIREKKKNFFYLRKWAWWVFIHFRHFEGQTGMMNSLNTVYAFPWLLKCFYGIFESYYGSPWYVDVLFWFITYPALKTNLSQSFDSFHAPNHLLIYFLINWTRRYKTNLTTPAVYNICIG